VAGSGRREHHGAVRLATLNTWGVRGDWPARRAVLAREFARLAPDLITLQETILTPSYDQARDVLGGGYHVVHQSDREPDGQGSRRHRAGRSGT
jgi:hypothetical protein